MNLNKELIGQGIGHLISGVYGGLPVAGASGKVQKRLEKFSILERIPAENKTTNILDALEQGIDFLHNHKIANNHHLLSS